MRSLIDKLVFEVFDFDYVKKNQSNNTNEFEYVQTQLNIRNVQFKNKIIKLKYIKKIFFFGLIKSLKKNNFIIEFDANRELLTKLLLLFICSFFFTNPIIAYQNKKKIFIRKFFIFNDINIYSDNYFIFLLKKIRNQFQNIYSIKKFKFILIKNEYIN